MRTRYEDKIKTALEMQCDSISASGTLKQKIDNEIRRQGKIVPISLRKDQEQTADFYPSAEMEDNTMKKETKKSVHFNAKKLVIGVAAACLLISGSVFAGKTAMFISGFERYDYTFEQLDEAEEKLGVSVDLVEDFNNGYHFQEMDVSSVRAADENADTIYTFYELGARYERDGVRDISLYAHEVLEESEKSKVPDMTDECNGIALRYDVMTYKFVPVGYELTEEDKANLERDDYQISEGSDEVEMETITHVTWEKDGVYYNLMGTDTALSGEEMFEMAKELIGAE